MPSHFPAAVSLSVTEMLLKLSSAWPITTKPKLLSRCWHAHSRVRVRMKVMRGREGGGFGCTYMVVAKTGREGALVLRRSPCNRMLVLACRCLVRTHKSCPMSNQARQIEFNLPYRHLDILGHLRWVWEGRRTYFQPSIQPVRKTTTGRL